MYMTTLLLMGKGVMCNSSQLSLAALAHSFNAKSARLVTCETPMQIVENLHIHSNQTLQNLVSQHTSLGERSQAIPEARARIRGQAAPREPLVLVTYGGKPIYMPTPFRLALRGMT